VAAWLGLGFEHLDAAHIVLLLRTSVRRQYCISKSIVKYRIPITHQLRLAIRTSNRFWAISHRKPFHSISIKKLSTMPFIPETKVDAPSKGNIEDSLPNLLDPLATSPPPKSSQVLLTPFAPVVFVEAKDPSLSSDLETNKYEPINVPTDRDPLVNPASDVGHDSFFTLSCQLTCNRTKLMRNHLY
jgi:hypothetical protein